MKTCKLSVYCPPQDDGAIVIYTGLSVRVSGHIVYVDRDADRRVATVRVRPAPGHATTGLEYGAVAEAADLLAARAQRFLGGDWTVLGWSTPAGGMTGAGA